MDDTYVLVAAIDFGTTFSGYAFSFKTDPKSVHMNKNWGVGSGCESYKTPTSVLTGPKGKFVAFGHEAEERYGQLIDEDDGDEYDLYRHFKMVLHRKEALSREAVISSVNGTLRHALDIFTMSLKFLKEHLLEALNKQLKNKADAHLVRWVITVPAIWSENAKQFMREAAFNAECIESKDSRNLIIALEPEAASLFCRGLDIGGFLHMKKTQKISFQTGMKYLVIDAGGGTVDITAHRIGAEEKIEELHIANGKALGGIKVDYQFIKLLDNILGNDFIRIFKKEVPQQWFNLMSTFEKVKKSFKPDGESKLVLSLGYAMGAKFQEMKRVSIEKVIKDKEHLGVSFRNGSLILKHELTETLFKNVVQGIINHIKSLLEEPVLKDISYILLVGGFGECTYLQQKLQNAFRHNITMLVPNEAQLAVIKGAILFGHNPRSISSRISLKTYGISAMRKFKPGVHESSRRETIHGRDWCRNVFIPIIKKGQAVNVGKVWEERRVPHKPDQNTMVIRLFSIDREELAPVEYIDQPDMLKLGVVQIPMPNIERGLDRAVMVKVILGGTEIEVSATDLTSNTTTNVLVDMLTR